MLGNISLNFSKTSEVIKRVIVKLQANRSFPFSSEIIDGLFPKLNIFSYVVD